MSVGSGSFVRITYQGFCHVNNLFCFGARDENVGVDEEFATEKPGVVLLVGEGVVGLVGCHGCCGII